MTVPAARICIFHNLRFPPLFPLKGIGGNAIISTDVHVRSLASTRHKFTLEDHIMPQEKYSGTIPVGTLGIVALESSRTLGQKVNDYIVQWRREREHEHASTIAFTGYERENYLIKAQCPRFGTGEAKAIIKESVRGDDLYLLVDVCNYSLTYTVCGQLNHMSPDDHFQDLKRIIAALNGKARRITVIMPFLYESRQHKRSTRESLDCALALQELANMGVENIITFDAHDPRVQNAIPLKSFETIMPTYQFIKALLNNVADLTIDADHMMVISPDEGAMGRAVYFATMLGLDMGMFYKRRDYSKIVDGRNPIIAHEFLGKNVEGKDVVILDDMISSGESMLDVAKQIKERGASRVFVCTTFGLFTEGFEIFDDCYNKGHIDRVITTNLTYLPPNAYEKPYFVVADMCKFMALIIDSMNHDVSIGKVLNPTDKIHALLKAHTAD